MIEDDFFIDEAKAVESRRKAVEGVQEVYGAKCVPVAQPEGKEAALCDVADLLSGKNLD